MPIITSLLDLDLYKLTIGNFIFSRYRNVIAEYQMKIRNGNEIDYWKYVPKEEFAQEIRAVRELSLTDDEAKYLRSLGYFTEGYIAFLSNKPMGESVVVWKGETLDRLLPNVNGKWASSMLYETFCLSIGNEIFGKNYANKGQISQRAVKETCHKRLWVKCDMLAAYNKISAESVNLVEFGTRRRLSFEWQRDVLQYLKETHLISSTSNVNFARVLSLKPTGTQAHELFMGFQGLFPVHRSQTEVLTQWLEFYNGKLAIALGDTLGDDKFDRDYTIDLANAYQGERHDSGFARSWCNRQLDRDRTYGIDSKTKTRLFSDGLNIPLAIGLHKEFSSKTKVAFGIGTDLTNDTFLPVPQAVMKMTHCNGQPVAKLSNNPAKATCPSAECLEYVKYVAANL